ncbi:unnamed protein product [Mytilus edulis]|uniref:Transposase Helix-turn-helix domain-containing protein n=1 Tax=Mytilus edulis TaxID=6550 RepID=A0A8S3TCR3_MYTED|nr:unnamed protein product [Mytilus edulis]
MEGIHCNFTLLGKLESGNTVERSEFQRLTTENINLKERVSEMKLTPNSLYGKEDKVKYLPEYLTLMKVFQLLELYVPESSRSPIFKFEKLMLVLMKLRLNLPIQDLAYRFEVSKSTVSRIFNSVIHVLYGRMKDFIFWLDGKQLQLTMPMEFRKKVLV